MYFRVSAPGIVNLRVEVTFDARERVWAEYETFCKSYQLRLRLDGEDFETVARLATGFRGKISCGKRTSGQVGAGMIHTGLGGIAVKIAMDTGQQLLHQKDVTHYIKPIKLMLVSFSKFDPAVEKKLATHPDLLN